MSAMPELIRPQKSDLPALKTLYLDCFDESKAAAEVMFGSVLDVSCAYAAVTSGEIVSALYLLPCEIALDGKTAKAHYLMGACTAHEYRGRGIMKELIAYALDDAKRRGDVFSILEPASESLYDYYAKIGYKEAFHSSVTDCDIDRIGKMSKKSLEACHLTKSSFDIYALDDAKRRGDVFSILEPASESLYDYYAKIGYKGAFHSSVTDCDIDRIGKMSKKSLETCHLTKSSFDIWQSLRFNICMSIRGSVLWHSPHLSACAAVNKCYGGGVLGCEHGYAFYTADEYGIFVDELVCLPEYADSFLCLLGKSLGVSHLSVRCPSFVKGGRSIKMGMALSLDGKTEVDFDYNAYLGLSFD